MFDDIQGDVGEVSAVYDESCLASGTGCHEGQVAAYQCCGGGHQPAKWHYTLDWKGNRCTVLCLLMAIGTHHPMNFHNVYTLCME